MADGALLRPRPAPALPVAALLAGRPAAEAAALLPRLFGLCRAAQETAARLAFGLDLPPDLAAAGRREILRDHLLKLLLVWPDRFGLPIATLPADWTDGGPALRRAVFGPALAPPPTGAGLATFLTSGLGVAPVLAAIAGRFAPGDAAAELPLVTPKSATRPGAVDNSVAARQAGHPAMRWIEAGQGRGPLWRAVARLYDIADALAGRLPPPVTSPGRALVASARGLYFVAAELRDGRIAGLIRVTPTDHLLAPGGVLDRSLASLPATAQALAPLLLDILDPCSPVTLEPQHA